MCPNLAIQKKSSMSSPIMLNIYDLINVKQSAE